jgi:excisionase family DNA binding protein
MDNIKTTKEAAESLGISSSRVRQLIRSGRIKATKLQAGLWLIEAEEIKNFSSLSRRAGRPRKE